MADLQTTSRPPRAGRSDAKPAPVIPLYPNGPNAPGEAAYRAVTPWRSRRDHTLDAIAEASARVARRKAEHQAQLAADTEVS